MKVSLTGVEKAFGSTPVLRGISLEVEEGEFLALLGPSGCGKSTLLRVLAGLETQDTGSVAIDGTNVDHLRPKARDIAMVFQSYALYPHMTVRENLALPLRMRRLSKVQRFPLVGRFAAGTRGIQAEIETEVLRTARSLELDGLLDRKPSQLSGGQRQRVAVGRALVRRPSVFLMDEPLSNLDAKLRVQMRAEMKELHRRLGITFVYVTHDQTEAMTMADKVGVIFDGELLQVGPPKSLYVDPRDIRIAEFVGSPTINILEGVAEADGYARAAGASLFVGGGFSSSTPIKIGVRPEHLEIVSQPGPDVLHGTVHASEYLGADLFLHVALPGVNDLLNIRATPELDGTIQPGATVAVRARTDHLLIFDEQGKRLPAAGVTLARAISISSRQVSHPGSSAMSGARAGSEPLSRLTARIAHSDRPA